MRLVHDAGQKERFLSRSMIRLVVLVAIVVGLSACGEAPLGSFGERSSKWINEPEVVTTTAVVVTVPEIVSSETLVWSNDDIVTENLADPNALVSEVFARREGDRFIQASRSEIAAALPGIRFPSVVPWGAGWVSSQLVIESTGLLSDDPSAAFGIWSAEPYTRSRSVAQMAVLRVATDPESATEISIAGDEASCARFAENTTEGCEILEISGRPVWMLSSPQGVTLVWFDDIYRYELFGRSFVPVGGLTRMPETSVLLADLVPDSS